MAGERRKQRSASLAIREPQMQTTRYYYTCIRKAKVFLNIITSNVVEDAEKLNHLYIADGNVK